MSNTEVHACRASILHCLRDPGDGSDSSAMEYFEDGILVIQNGRIVEIGPAEVLLKKIPAETKIEDHRGKFLVPGFVDTHIHFVQTDIIASYGEQLLAWLEKYTFPAERAFADPMHAKAVSEFFIDELLRNGTTTALVLGSVHTVSADAVFTAAQNKNMRLIAGKVLMDRNCPDYLRDTAETGYIESRKLIERWHKHDRLEYAITPRFAPTSSPEQMRKAAQLAHEYPDTYIHTHLAENRAEVEWVENLFPDQRSYLDVYDSFDLLRERTVMAHSIYLDEKDLSRLSETGVAISACPTCNLFIGSGLFDFASADAQNVRVGLGTDVGGGDSFSMLRVLNEAYKVAQLQGQTLNAWRLLYMATLGGARALYLDDKIGNFTPGKEADFLILDPEATPLIARRTALCQTTEEKLFAMIMLGDDRLVSSVYVMGRETHSA